VSARHRLSLSQRLLVSLFIVSFTYWGVIAWLTIRDSVDEVYELFDAHLAQTAVALPRVADPDDKEAILIQNQADTPSLREIFQKWPNLAEHRAKTGSGAGNSDSPSAAPARADTSNSISSLQGEYDMTLRFQVWNRQGQLIMKSPNARDTAMTDRDGFSETTSQAGQIWRHFGIWDRHRQVRVLVTEAHDVRNRLIRSITLHVASPLALGLPVLLFLLWFSISRGLNPLAHLTREIASRKPESLTPLDANDAPGEVRPMVSALNDLLLRMTYSLGSERRFTANAAHELRTPLAAIQAQLHAARAAEGEDERLRAMDQLQRGVERGKRLVGQLLTLARLDPEHALPEAQPTNPGEMAEAICAELAPLALQKDQDLELLVAPDLPWISANSDLLSVLLGNLVDNSIRYTPRKGHIRVAIRQHETGVLMEVSDDGPGIPASQRERAFERFYRIAGQDQPGTGLGLAICCRIAELHGARVDMADGPDGRGLTIRVFLPGLPAQA